MDKEQRFGAIETVEGEEKVVEGYALKFNSLSEDLGGFKEIIMPGALVNTDLSDVRCFLDHDTSKLLGRTVAKTLELVVDDIGLKVRCKLPNTTLGNDTFELISRGDLNQMSFAFFLDKGADKFERSDKGYLRKIHAIKRISEVSIVSIPAYNDTDIMVAKRNLKTLQKTEQEKLIVGLQLMRAY